MNLNENVFKNRKKERFQKINNRSTRKITTIQVGVSRHTKPRLDTNDDNNNSAQFGFFGSGGSTSYINTSHSTKNNNPDGKFVLAVTEGRGEAQFEVGLAWTNVTRPSLVLCQISDVQSYVNVLTKINVVNPDEILIPATMESSRLTEKLKEHFKNTKINAISRISFNKIDGLQYIKKLCAPAWNSILLILQHKYYALTAAGALLDYLENHLNVYYAKESIKVDYQESEGNMIIDIDAADKLELVSCACVGADQNAKYSNLKSVLNHCVTKIGNRALRANILQPPSNIEEIEERLNCVEELVNKSENIHLLQEHLKKISHIDILLTLGTVLPNQGHNSSTKQLNYLLLLNQLFNLLEPVSELFATTEQQFFMEVRQLFLDSEFETLKAKIREIITPEARPATSEQGIHERCFAIKHGVNELFDLVRKNYSNLLDEMREYVVELKGKYSLDLRLANNSKKGYHICLPLGKQQQRSFQLKEVPEEFVQVERHVTSITMKTIDLIVYSSRLEDMMNEILKMSNVIIHTLMVEAHARIGLFHKLCEFVAKLDLLQALAQASLSETGYIRPTFGRHTEVVGGRHPLLEFLRLQVPVQNDAVITPEHNINIITGPNGAGKSIFIRQMVLLQIMAQIGCYIPAERAMFKVADRIMARIYLEDNMECGVSAFVLEMKEIQYFINTMNEGTLVIVDELCRSTSVDEGTALAMAISEKFAQQKSFVWIATHYTFITNLEKMYFNFKCWQLEGIVVESTNGKKMMQYTHKMLPGVTTHKDYAMYLARDCWPEVVTKDVDYLLETCIKRTSFNGVVVELNPVLKLKYNVEAEFRRLKALRVLTADKFRQCIGTYKSNINEIDWQQYQKHKAQIVERSQELNEVELVPQIQNIAPSQRSLNNLLGRDVSSHFSERNSSFLEDYRQDLCEAVLQSASSTSFLNNIANNSNNHMVSFHSPFQNTRYYTPENRTQPKEILTDFLKQNETVERISEFRIPEPEPDEMPIQNSRCSSTSSTKYHRTNQKSEEPIVLHRSQTPGVPSPVEYFKAPTHYMPRLSESQVPPKRKESLNVSTSSVGSAGLRYFSLPLKLQSDRTSTPILNQKNEPKRNKANIEVIQNITIQPAQTSTDIKSAPEEENVNNDDWMPSIETYPKNQSISSKTSDKSIAKNQEKDNILWSSALQELVADQSYKSTEFSFLKSNKQKDSQNMEQVSIRDNVLSNKETKPENDEEQRSEELTEAGKNFPNECNIDKSDVKTNVPDATDKKSENLSEAIINSNGNIEIELSSSPKLLPNDGLKSVTSVTQLNNSSTVSVSHNQGPQCSNLKTTSNSVEKNDSSLPKVPSSDTTLTATSAMFVQRSSSYDSTQNIDSKILNLKSDSDCTSGEISSTNDNQAATFKRNIKSAWKPPLKRKKVEMFNIFETNSPNFMSLFETTSPQNKSSKSPGFFIPAFSFGDASASISVGTDSSSRKSKPFHKLTTKEVEQEYMERDLQHMQNPGTSTALHEYEREIVNRPRASKIKYCREVVRARKTETGVTIVNVNHPTKVGSKKKKFLPPLKREAPQFDVTLFSDKNLNAFNEYMQLSDSP